jgi:vacuolar-type H+-ATPase subunit H
MKKIAKILGIVILVFILFLFIAPMLFKGKIKDLITEQANNYLNAKLEFADVDLSLIRSFPDFSIRIEGLSLSGVGDFEKDTLVAFDYFQTDVNLMSLMGDAVEIKSIVLNKPRVLAKVLKDGRVNWDIMKEDSTAVEETAEEDTTSSTFKLSLNNFQINNADIVYDDAEGDIYAGIKDLNFTLSGDMTESRTVLDINTTINSFTTSYEEITYLKNVKMSYLAAIDADLDKFIFIFKENKFSLNEILMAFDGKIEIPADDIGIDLKFSTGKTAFKPVLSLIPAVYKTDFEGVETSGQFKIDGYVKGIYNDNNLPSFVMNLLVENGRFAYPDLPESVENINVDMHLENKGGSGDDNIVDIKKAHIEMAKNPFDARMKIITTADDVDMEGKITGKIDFGGIKDVVPLEEVTIKGLMNADLEFGGKLSSLEAEKYDEFKADGKIELSGFSYESSDLPNAFLIPAALMTFTPDNVRLEKMDMKTGNTDMSFTGTMDNLLAYAFADSTLVGRFKFSSNYFDAGDFLTEEESSSSTEVETVDTVPFTAFAIPGNIDFLLKSNMKQIIYDNLTISNLKGDILLKDSKMIFNGVKMNMLEGSVLMDGYYDSKDTLNPKIGYDMSVKNLDLPATFETFNTVQRLAPIAKKAQGDFTMDMNFTTNLDYYLNPVYKTMNGKGRFQSKNIALKEVKVFNTLAQLTKWDKLANPALKDVDVKFEIENGNIKVEPTTMKLGKSKMEFGGTQSLEGNLNYDLKFAIAKADLGAGVTQFADNLLQKTGKDIKLGDEIKLNAVVVGTVDNPKVKLAGSKDGGAKEAVGDEAKKAIEKADEEAQKIIAKAEVEADKIRQEADEAGKKLIAEADKKAEQLKAEADKQAQKIIAEADKQGKELIAKANNPISKAAARKAAEKLNKEAKKSADKVRAEADKKAQLMHEEAQKKADKLNQEADKKANAVIDKAKQQTESMKNSADNKADNL